MYYRFSALQLNRIRSECNKIGLEDVAGTDVKQDELTFVRTSISLMLKRSQECSNFRDYFCDCGAPQEEVSAFKALMLLERIRLTYSTSGCPREWEPSMEQYALLLLQWSLLYHRNLAEKIGKFLSCNIFSYITRQDLLEPIALPFGWSRFSMGPSKWRNHIRHLRVTKMGEKKLKAAQSFLYLKKGTPIVSETFVKESLKKHKQALSVERIVPNVVLIPTAREEAEVVFLRKEIKRRVKVIISSIRRGQCLPTRNSFWEPSPNASFGKSRSKGGLAGELKWEIVEDTVDQRWFNGELVSLPEIRDCITLEKEFKCAAVPICEPFKVRVITKGPANATYALKGLQMALWELMSKHPRFDLIGRTVRASDIPHLEEDQSWLSGDFSAATDNLAAWCSKVIGKELSLQFDLPEKLVVDSLCGNVISYGEYAEDESLGLEPFIQKNGQLMGSVLSFLVLNIINAALLWLVKDPFHSRRYSFENQSFKVNGDDSVCAMTEIEKIRWYALSGELGLVPSVGKTYYSSEFAIINSTCFARTNKVETVWVPFVNGDYLQHHQGKGGEERKVYDLSAIQRDLIKGFDSETQDELKKLFIQSHRGLLDSEAGDIDWYLPKSVGGIGLSYRSRLLIGPLLDGEARALVHPTMSENNWNTAFACLKGWIPTRKALKSRWNDRHCIRKSEMNRYYDELQVPRPTRKVGFEDSEWVKSEKKSVSGLSSLYIQSKWGKVVRDDTEYLDLKSPAEVPFKYRSKTIKDWLRLLRGVCDPKTIDMNILCPILEFSTDDVRSYFEDDFDTGPKMVENQVERIHVEAFIRKNLDRTVMVDGDLGTNFAPKIPKSTERLARRSRYLGWLWGLVEKWNQVGA